MMQKTRFTQTNRVPCWCPCHAHIRTLHWAPRGHEASPPKNIYPPASFFCLITHFYCVSTVCDVSCSQSRLHPSKIYARLEGFSFFITHGCYLRTVCDAPS